MLMVLRSVARSSVAGVREWTCANVLAIVALLLFAARGRIPDVLSIDVANLLFLGAPALMLAGFERHLGRRAPYRALAALVTASTVALGIFHYGVDAMAVRVALSSFFHGIVCVAMAWGLRPWAHPDRARYPIRFAFGAALTLAAAHAVRAVMYASHHDAQVTLFDSSPVNLVCFALGTLALPGLTLGAVMMANAGLIGQARYAAEHDHLTGAWSRRAFFGRAERAHADAVRRGGPLSLLIFDVDHFKAINDTHGHAVGDQVLADLVARTGTVLRGDVCARLGGEEFAVLLPDTDADAAVRLADELRRTLERADVAGAGAGVVRFTVSVGVASLDEGESLESLLQRADAALYAAKRGGRNQVQDARATEDVGETLA
ncbi:GGDEF domain-containing protein [Telluria mixta]|uniref:diguanylate cyclase n=1 Tax=Telluria mixta TaxID=34071 RepID=A0ABT2C3Q0_9BURK|nr:GGDEF domain-containing protein [Telluria mixta]MCS0632017.1 GGDEF domain-containing protein [Telluria mixta]WEM95306.1 GGDEF domain-containing protein [Telluria mixta]